MLFSSFKNLVSFFRQSNSGLTKSNISNQFCKPVVGLCALLCMSLWISAAQAQQMRTNLAFANLIPASYTDSNSEVITATIGVIGGILARGTYDDLDRTDAVFVGLVDWVEVQIRVVANTVTDAPTLPGDAANIYIKAAWLLSDGSVVDVDSDIAAINGGTEGELTIPTGTDGLTFDAATQNLYVLINHRSHLPIMSASVVTAGSEGVYDYDFTTSVSQAEGGVSALKETGGVPGMYVGDTNVDGGVSNADVDSGVRANIGNSTYHVGDVTLDANVGGADVSQAQANIGASQAVTY